MQKHIPVGLTLHLCVCFDVVLLPVLLVPKPFEGHWQHWWTDAQIRSAPLVAQSVIIMIMYIYHALINALSAHMIHINLNMIFYTHVEHSPTKTIYIKYYMEKHTHTHTHDYSRVWKKGAVKWGLECVTDHYVQTHIIFNVIASSKTCYCINEYLEW